VASDASKLAAREIKSPGSIAHDQTTSKFPAKKRIASLLPWQRRQAMITNRDQTISGWRNLPG